MIVEASAPSNIALIKYMGKIEGTGNRPANASISYSLEHLRTWVTLEPLSGAADEWAPLERAGLAAPELSAVGREKFLKHFARMKEALGVSGFFRIRSANNFPSDCGLASSASSFAALTLAAAQLQPGRLDVSELSRLSRQGSGSSCRSLFTPWALWEGEGAESVEIPTGTLLHAAVIVSAGVKEVSSSQAHERVTTSPRFEGRVARAHERLRRLISALKESDWRVAFDTCWDEFVDMHELFETSQPAFGYRRADSKAVVDAAKHIWSFKGDGPLVTMDAGPNVHLLFRPDQRELAEKMVKFHREKHKVITSWGGWT